MPAAPRVSRGVRIAIIGAPRAGKTTLAQQFGREHGYMVWHADDLIPLGWSQASDEVTNILTSYQDLDFVFEGVAVVRALRKALLLRPDEAPVDRCIVLERPRLTLSPRQRAMARGCATVLASIEPELVRRGVWMERPT